MRRALALEVMLLHHTLEAFSFRPPNYIDPIARLKLSDVQIDVPLRRISIETQHDPTNAVARIIVSDNGPGVPPADREKLFMPYYSTKRRGSGLGLAIVRRIVTEHGGSIELGDNSPQGSRFVIELPC